MDRVSHRLVNCERCAFWAELNNRDGTCRRHAPRTSGTIDEIAHWPLTHRSDQCGEGVAAEAATVKWIICSACVYWRKPPAGGLMPYGRRDQPIEWWAHAGHCTRFAPFPATAVGGRAFWRVTHSTDGCSDGEAEES